MGMGAYFQRADAHSPLTHVFSARLRARGYPGVRVRQDRLGSAQGTCGLVDGPSTLRIILIPRVCCRVSRRNRRKATIPRARAPPKLLSPSMDGHVTQGARPLIDATASRAAVPRCVGAGGLARSRSLLQLLRHLRLLVRTRVHGEAGDLALNPRDSIFQVPDLCGSSVSLGMAQVSKETYCKAKKDLTY